MAKKVLVTKEFHQRALRAIKFQQLHGDNEMADFLRQSWMSYMENKADDELVSEFVNYCEMYAKEIGFDIESLKS